VAAVSPNPCKREIEGNLLEFSEIRARNVESTSGNAGLHEVKCTGSEEQAAKLGRLTGGVAGTRSHLTIQKKLRPPGPRWTIMLSLHSENDQLMPNFDVYC
jgi:hypothetical protein